MKTLFPLVVLAQLLFACAACSSTVFVPDADDPSNAGTSVAPLPPGPTALDENFDPAVAWPDEAPAGGGHDHHKMMHGDGGPSPEDEESPAPNPPVAPDGQPASSGSHDHSGHGR